MIVGVSSLIDMVFFLPAGLIMDRFGRKFASVPAFVMLSAGMLFVAFSSDAITLFLAATLMSVGNGFGSGSMMTLGADLSPPEARGEFMGFWRLVGDSGSTGGPLLVGGVADLWGLTTAAVAVAATGALAVLTLGLFVPETSSLPDRQSARIVSLVRSPLVGQIPAPSALRGGGPQRRSPGFQTASHLHDAAGIVGDDDFGFRVTGAAQLPVEEPRRHVRVVERKRPPEPAAHR